MNKKALITLTLSSGLLFAADLYTTRSDCNLSDGSVGTIFELEMGDDSCDGHCMTATRNICSNLNAEEISAAYTASKEKVGFNFIQDVADEYEDNSLSMEKLKTLRENGVATWQFEDERYAEEGEELESVSLNSDTYSQIYLELVKLGNAEFKQETLQGKNLSIGGYGLFSH
jgi:hypothetical protein